MLRTRTFAGMTCATDLIDEQWALLQPVFCNAGKRGRKHADDLRTVVDAMLYIAELTAKRANLALAA